MFEVSHYTANMDYSLYICMTKIYIERERENLYEFKFSGESKLG